MRGWWGRCEKNYLRKEEGREGGEKKHAQRARGTRDLPRARQGSPAARQGGCLGKQAFPLPIIRVGRLRNTGLQKMQSFPGMAAKQPRAACGARGESDGGCAPLRS